MPTASTARAIYGVTRAGSRTDVQPYVASVLRAPSDIAAMAGEWSQLERRSNDASLFQSPQWSMLACRTFQDLQDRGFAPLVVTVRRGRELVAVAPFKTARSGPIELATDLSDPFGQYGGMLVARDTDHEAIVTQVVDALRSGINLDGLCMRRVRADSPVCAAFLRRGFAAGLPDAAPFIDLSTHADFRAFQQTVNAKSRKNLRNLRNRLARIAPVSHRVAVGEDVRQVIDESFTGRLRWLDEHGIPSMAFDHPALGAMLDGIRALAQKGDLSILAMGLYCGDDPVSLQWGFIHRDRYYAFIAARNPEFDAYSPGRLHLEDVIQTCFERGIQVCDFLAPAARYKLTWTEQATEVIDIAMPFTITGRLWLDAWNRRLRPAIKSRYSQLPLWLRRRIRRMTSDSSAA